MTQFDSEFRSQMSAIETSLKAANPDTNELLKQVDEIQQSVKLQIGSLSTHDIEKYDTALQETREKIWRSKKAKRFQFKSGPKVAPKSTDPINTAAATTSERSPSEAEKRRVVSLKSETFANLSLANLDRSVIIAPDITGALHILNATNSMLVIRCAQCRIHDCRNLSIQLEGCTNPVIENSSAIRFYVPHPDIVNVSDFSWMRSDTNPNYTLAELAPLASSVPNKVAASYTQDDAKSLMESL